MKPYKSFQITWTLFIIMLPIMAFFVILHLLHWGNTPLPINVLIFSESIFLAVLLLFYGLKITLTDKQLKASFGIGIISKRIKLEDTASTKVVKNQWYNGIGIRIIPNGMLYNAHGMGAVELIFKHKKKVVRIGSPENEILKEEIDKRLKMV